ncbi:hypothetical protein GQ457_04G021970 [Hibiscus cannabinus]
MNWKKPDTQHMIMPRFTQTKQKKWHNQKILPRQYQPGQQVLLFNSRLKLFPGKLKSIWSGSFIITNVSPHGAITIKSPRDNHEFKVNGQRLKLYMGAHTERDKGLARANLNWVLEFYTNNAAGDDNATVRGRRVAANAAIINSILGLPNDEPSVYAMLDALEDEDYEQIKHFLCEEGTAWNTTGRNPHSVSRPSFCLEARLWNTFVKRNLMPTSHNQMVDRTRLVLIHTIMTGYRINVGKILAQELAAACKNDKDILAFPCLISALCRRAAVPTSPGDKYTAEKQGWTRAVYMLKMDVADATPISVAILIAPTSPIHTPTADPNKTSLSPNRSTTNTSNLSTSRPSLQPHFNHQPNYHPCCHASQQAIYTGVTLGLDTECTFTPHLSSLKRQHPCTFSSWETSYNGLRRGSSNFRQKQRYSNNLYSVSFVSNSPPLPPSSTPNPRQHQLQTSPPPPSPFHLPTPLQSLETLKKTAAPAEVPILSLAPTPANSALAARITPDSPARRKGKAPVGRTVSRHAPSSPDEEEQLQRPAKRQRRCHIITVDSDDDSSDAVPISQPEKSVDPSLSSTF